MSTSNEADFIPGIYTHCDRWCERCQFTDRCRSYAMQAERGWFDDDDAEFNSDDLVRELTDIFAETKQMLIEEAEKWGIDPTPISDEEFAEIRSREDQFVEGDELSQLGESYWRPAKEILEDEALLKKSADDEALTEALSVLFHFLFFIPVNVKSSLNALLDHEGFEDKEQATDPQSYANGSAKSALIAIDRTIIAWRCVRGFGKADRVQPLIELLESMRTKLEERFPLARDFVRPGFDEIEVVM